MTRIISINLLITLCLLLMLELGSRLLGHVSFPDPMIATTKADWGMTRLYDPDLFWRLMPNTTLNSQVVTNNLGLRGPQIGPKEPTELRILSLGESTTFGIQLPLESTYSFRLEQIMGTAGGRRVRVINAGVPGYSLFQGAAYLKCCGLALEPDAVMLYFGFNDFLPISYRTARDAGANATHALLTDIELFEQRQKLIYRITHALATYSNLARFIMFRWRNDASSVAHQSSYPRVPPEDRLKLLTEILAIAREHSQRLIIIVPWYLNFSAHEHLLREFATANDVLLVDIPKRTQELGLNKLSYFIDPVHPNAAGHEVIANLTANELRWVWQ